MGSLVPLEGCKAYALTRFQPNCSPVPSSKHQLSEYLLSEEWCSSLQVQRLLESMASCILACGDLRQYVVFT